MLRITMNLTDKSVDAVTAIEQLVESDGNRSDVINKAVQVYALLLETQAAGGAVYLREAVGAELERVRFL